MRATLILSLLAAASSGVALFAPELDAASALEPALRAHHVANLFVLPVFLWCARQLRHGSPRATLGWLGCLGHLFYTSTGAVFAAHWNALFLLQLALFSGCVFVLMRGVLTLNARALHGCIDGAAPRRSALVFLLFVASLLAISELTPMLSALAHGRVPESIGRSGPAGKFVYVLDLGVIVPLTLLAVRWLWWRQPWGDVLAGMLLIQSAVTGVALLSMTVFAVQAGQPFDRGLTLAYALMALGGVALSARFLRHCHASAPCEMAPQGLAAIARSLG